MRAVLRKSSELVEVGAEAISVGSHNQDLQWRAFFLFVGWILPRNVPRNEPAQSRVSPGGFGDHDFFWPNIEEKARDNCQRWM